MAAAAAAKAAAARAGDKEAAATASAVEGGGEMDVGGELHSSRMSGEGDGRGKCRLFRAPGGAGGTATRSGGNTGEGGPKWVTLGDGGIRATGGGL